MEKNLKRWKLFFQAYLAAFALLRLYFVHDIELPINYQPHDAGLYVSRAFYLVTAANFGPYDGRLFVKDPGSSLIMAFSRLIGFDYITFINILHIVAAAYLALGMVRVGISRCKSAAVFSIALALPLTLSSLWYNLFRENLDCILSLLFFSALMFLMIGWRRGNWPRFDLFVFCISGVLLFFLREEAILLFSVFGFVAIVEIVRLRYFGQSPRVLRLRQVRAAPLGFLLALLVVLVKGLLIAFYFARYDTFVMNDFNSGEFPRFIAALRSVSGEATRPYVSITFEGLRKAASAVPYLDKLRRAIPAPPPHGSAAARFYGDRYGVWDEWTNSHIMFWIKDAAYITGFTPTPTAAQAFFRKAAQDIEAACAAKKVSCVKQPFSISPLIVPPVKLAWFPNIAAGILDGITNAVRVKGVSPPDEPTYLVKGAEGPGWVGSLFHGRMHQFVGKIPFDSLAQMAHFTLGRGVTPDDFAVTYWCRYPDLIAAPGYGLADSVTSQFRDAFQNALGIGSIDLHDPRRVSTKDMQAIRSFLQANHQKPCWVPKENTVLLAALMFLRQPGGQGLLKSPTGALRHFIEHGRAEGRIWGDPVSFGSEEIRRAANAPPKYAPLVGQLRSMYVKHLQDLPFLMVGLAGLTALFRRERVSTNPFTVPVLILLAYAGVKILALSYIAITMGLVDPRLYASTNYVLSVFLAGFFLDCTANMAAGLLAAADRQVSADEVTLPRTFIHLRLESGIRRCPVGR